MKFDAVNILALRLVECVVDRCRKSVLIRYCCIGANGIGLNLPKASDAMLPILLDLYSTHNPTLLDPRFFMHISFDLPIT
ncbi:hypothetical protein [Microvirga zambiensis]|uniref:hypothetical protein n=1 Tax=Microvirga zambiensis TaxID=1402137 RepID=UPI00191FB8B4|nr:hypothetical protein [Microvirga zambiensis]